MAIEVVVDVAAPLRTTYDRWTRFESFPRFMPLVQAVTQVRPTVTRWRLGRGPLHHEFEAEVVEQHPDERVAWRSLDSRFPHRGEVTFAATGERRTRVRLVLDDDVLAHRWSEPVVRRLAVAQLAAFGRFVEGVGDAGETWRGTIRRGRVTAVEKDAPAHPGWVHG
ncbi:SRPBCC family protein [Nocardioides litoris]|uniref:SRPBCC family protein n=1 Tax=Nocardioides litoris TaxID=1926648 RepID=UPI0011238860|nr:SRPBCC family protein [Nocardioides litoris]